MPVKHYDTNVEIVCGDLDEKWAAIESPVSGGSQVEVEVVPLSELKSDMGYNDLYERVVQATEVYSLDFETHLMPTQPRLKVEISERAIRVLTCNDEILYEVNPQNDLRNTFSHSDTMYECADSGGERVMSIASAIEMAHSQPKRFVFQHQDNLIEP